MSEIIFEILTKKYESLKKSMVLGQVLQNTDFSIFFLEITLYAKNGLLFKTSESILLFPNQLLFESNAGG